MEEASRTETVPSFFTRRPSSLKAKDLPCHGRQRAPPSTTGLHQGGQEGSLRKRELFPLPNGSVYTPTPWVKLYPERLRDSPDPKPQHVMSWQTGSVRRPSACTWSPNPTAPASLQEMPAVKAAPMGKTPHDKGRDQGVQLKSRNGSQLPEAEGGGRGAPRRLWTSSL